MQWRERLELAWQQRRINEAYAVDLCKDLSKAGPQLGLSQEEGQDLAACIDCLQGLIAIYNSDYETAQSLLDPSLEHLNSKRGQMTLWLARCGNARGYLHAVRGQFGEALVHFKEALEWSTAIENAELSVFILFNIAELYREVLERYDEAKSYYEAALEWATADGGHVLLGSIYSNLSGIWLNLGDVHRALDFAQQALQLAKNNRDPYALGVCYDTLAIFYTTLGDLDQAWSYTELASMARQGIRDNYANATTWLQQARICHQWQRDEDAVMWGRRSLMAAAKLRSKATITEALEILAKSYEGLGDTRRAMQFYKAYSKKASEKFSADLASQMSVLASEAKFLALKKDAEIHRLRNVELKLKSEQIERVVNELTDALNTLKSTQEQLLHAEKMAALGRLVAGVAHELNTPLGISITMASYLQEKLNELLRALGRGAVDEGVIEEHIKANQEVMDIIDKSLQRAADIVRSFKNLAMNPELLDQSTIALRPWLDEFLIAFRIQYPDVKLNIKTQCDPIVLASYVNALAAVLTELLLNANYHAYQDPAAITVRLILEQKQNQLSISCCDDGLGLVSMDPASVFEPFTTTKRLEGHIGLGLHSVYNIVKQILKGSIDLDSQARGFCVQIEFPLHIEAL